MTTTPPPRSETITAAALSIRQLMTSKGRLTRQRIRKALDDAFLTRGESWWDTSDAHEACETATVDMLFTTGALLHETAACDAELDAVVARIAAGEPRMRGKAERHAQMQHHATPIRIGWAMALAAGIKEGDAVLDPSAGTGTLLALAYLACPAATLHANEAAGIRAATLRTAAPQVAVENADATTLETTTPAWRQAHDIVVMNPPASARLGETKKRRNEDLRHLRAAAAMVRPNGRIVALLAGGTEPRGRAWEKIIGAAVRLTWCALIDGTLAENRDHTASSMLCVLDNRAEDDAFDPERGTEHYIDAERLWAAARTIGASR